MRWNDSTISGNVTYNEINVNKTDENDEIDSFLLTKIFLPFLWLTLFEWVECNDVKTCRVTFYEDKPQLFWQGKGLRICNISWIHTVSNSSSYVIIILICLLRKTHIFMRKKGNGNHLWFFLCFCKYWENRNSNNYKNYDVHSS